MTQIFRGIIILVMLVWWSNFQSCTPSLDNLIVNNATWNQLTINYLIISGRSDILAGGQIFGTY